MKSNISRLARPTVVVAAAAAALVLGMAACSSATTSKSLGTAHSQAALRPGDERPGIATIDPAVAQTISGFGASGDWWVIPVHYFPTAAQRHIADLLFSRTGIELSQYRYNIGGGGVGVDKQASGESELGFHDRSPQTFYVAPGKYDWSHDPGGTAFLQEAARYHVPTIEANVNSAPPQFTTNNQSCGGQLNPIMVQAYARYLTTVIKHLRDALDVTINYVSPMNEPDSTRSDCTQEGMEVPPALRATLVKDLGKDLANQAPYTKIIADESSDVGSQFTPELPHWMGVSGASQYVAALATHTYDFPSDTTMRHAAALAKSYGKPLWATEICCFRYHQGSSPTYSEQFDPTITGGLAMAQVIYEDLTAGDAAAFDWWVALSAAEGCDPAKARCMTTLNSTGWNDGLLYFDPNFATDHDYNVYPTKRFYTLGQFSRFVRPGAQRHDVVGVPARLDVLAFNTGSQWEVVVINLNAAGSVPATFSLQFPGTGSLQALRTYQTSTASNLSQVANPRVHGSTARLTTSAQSITTFILGQSG